MPDRTDGIDFALAAFREEGVWQVQELAHDVLDGIDTLSHALRRFPGDGGSVGMIGVDEDFFVLVRVAGASTRVLLSDFTAADEWELARSAVEFLGHAAWAPRCGNGCPRRASSRSRAPATTSTSTARARGGRRASTLRSRSPRKCGSSLPSCGTSTRRHR